MALVPFSGEIDAASLPPGPAGPPGPPGPAGPAGPAGSVAGSPTTNLSVNQLDVYGRIRLHFDPRLVNGKPKKPYTELQWVDDSTGLVMGQIVTHTVDDTGAVHNHMSFYTAEAGQPNGRKHHFSIHWHGDGTGAQGTVIQNDSVVIADYHNDTLTQRIEVSPNGQAWLVGVDNNGAWTATKTTLPPQS